jgi:hypothetical protein
VAARLHAIANSRCTIPWSSDDVSGTVPRAALARRGDERHCRIEREAADDAW